jgi:TonB family protein
MQYLSKSTDSKSIFNLFKPVKNRSRIFLKILIGGLILGLSACSHSDNKNSPLKGSTMKEPPLYVVNGHIMSTDSARNIISRIKSKYIKSVHVIQSKDAKLLFGKKGRGGAIKYKIPNKKKAFHDLLEPASEDSSGHAAENGYDKVYEAADKQPVLKNGLKELEKKVKYPKKCKQAGIEGRVLVQVIVNKHGLPENPKIIKSLGHGCDKEAVRVAKMARFTPGKVNGKPVNVKYLLPVIFSKHNRQN